MGKIKIKNFEKNCCEVVWPPLALCRGGGASPAAFAGAQSADSTQAHTFAYAGIRTRQNGCKTDGNDRLAVLSPRAAGKMARAFQKTTGRRVGGR